MTDEKDPKTGRFLPGNSGFGGRPKGSRNKLGEAFLDALHADFKEHGVEALTQCREQKPDVYVRVVASLLPQQVEVKETLGDLTEDELRAVIAAARSLEADSEEGGAGTRH